MIDYTLTFTIVDRKTGDAMLYRTRTLPVPTFDGVDDRGLLQNLTDSIKRDLVPGGSTVMELQALREVVRDSEPRP
jgi:hypothetical protein